LVVNKENESLTDLMGIVVKTNLKLIWIVGIGNEGASQFVEMHFDERKISYRVHLN
jgi:hypothetical protein